MPDADRLTPAAAPSALADLPSRASTWTGRTLSGLAALFLTFDAGIKLLRSPVAIEGTSQLGYPAAVVFPLGIVQAICLVL